MAVESPRAFGRILITRMKFVGDIVLTTPVIRSVRAAFPEAFIAYMGESRAVRLLEHFPGLDEIIPFDFSRPTLLEQPRVSAMLIRRRFDLVLDLFGNPRSALLTFLSGARVRVGPDRRGRRALYTVRVRDDGLRKTAVDFHFQSLRAVGIPPVASSPEIVLTAEECVRADELLDTLVGRPGGASAGPPVVALHPGATWPAKRWAPERFAQLADHLAENLGAAVVLTGAVGDAAAVDATQKHSRSKPPHTGQIDLRHLAAVLSRCSAVVANDGGPMHIAAAVGTPTIGVFGPGEEDIWFPYDPRHGHQALRQNVSCHPCHLNVCNRPGEAYMECMKRLSVGHVVSAVGQLLSAAR